MLKSNEIQTLRDRWLETQRQEAIDFLTGKTRVYQPTTSAGQTDLRGLLIDRFVRERRHNNIDLSASKLIGFGQFGYCTFENCNFSQAELTTNLGRQFFGCQFRKARIKQGSLNGEFHDCDFDLANLAEAGGNQVKFVRCSFRGTNFKRAILLNCLFEDCVLEECSFGGGSFGKARFVNTSTTNCDFQDTILSGAVFG